jgi:perosamine synthetase
MMFRLVPPAGTLITMSDLARMVRLRLRSGSSTDSFERKLRGLMNVRHGVAFNSGRSALTCLLTAMAVRAQSKRDEVILPAYTCFSVPAAVIKAGLRVRLIDISLSDLDYDYDQFRHADLSRVLAVISCNLFGIPSDTARLESMLKDRQIFVIDDAAQAMGTMVGDIACGCRGDAGIFSFGRGKNLSTCSGGMVVTNDDDLAATIGRLMDSLPGFGAAQEAVLAAEIALTGLLLRPCLYWIPDNLPFLGLGKTVFDADFEIARLQPFQETLGQILIDRLRKMNDERTRVASQIAAAAGATSLFEIPGYHEGHSPCYLRLPLLAKDRGHRNAVIDSMKRGGIKASIMYPSTIAEIDGIAGHLRGSAGHYPNAGQVVERLFTLPTHGYVRQKDTEIMIRCLTEPRKTK